MADKIRNYWKEVYGTRGEDFTEGVIAGITAFAIWENGKQYVGIDKEPLEKVIEEVKEGLGRIDDEETEQRRLANEKLAREGGG